MQTLLGKIYKKEAFDNYELRAKCLITDKKDEHYNIDIYTTETNKDEVWDTLLDLTTDKVKSFDIIHWATREQDEKASELIKEWLNEA